jgi:CheY-like chemotaxis protein
VTTDTVTQIESVLVIGNDVKWGKLVARMLRPAYHALVSTSAQEALDRIAEGAHFALILCDLHMPGMDGMDFHARLNATAPELADRVVFMTGGAFTTRAAEFVSRDSTQLLHKPFGIVELQQAVLEHLVRLSAPRGSP